MTVSVWPTARPPTVHVTVPALCEQDPWVVVAPTKESPLGSGSCSVTPVAGEGPLLVAWIV